MAVDLYQEVIRGGITIVTAGFAAWIGVKVGLKVFLRQKEFELVKQRYLEDGIDVIAAHHEAIMGVFHHNWARTLQLTKMFRDSGKLLDVTELQRGFLELDSSKFHVIAHHRLGLLVGTHVFWEVYQLASSFAVNANAIVTKEIPDAFRQKLTTDKVQADVQFIAEKAFDRLKELDGKSHKFALLTTELEALAGVLQTEPLTFKHALAFRESPAVKAAIGHLETEYAQELNSMRGPSHNPSRQPAPVTGRD